MREHTRLPGARAGHEQQGPAGVGHRLPLHGVQVLEEVAARHRLRSSPAGQRSGVTLRGKVGGGYSHSMVPGGFDVTSKATRFTPGTSLMSRVDMRSSTS